MNNPRDKSAFVSKGLKGLGGSSSSECADVFAARRGDQDALVRLLNAHRSLIRQKGRQYFLPNGDVEDLVQEATIGFIKAIRDFRPELGIPFRSFAELCVRRQVFTAIKSATRQKHILLNSALSLHQPVYDDNSVALIDRISSECEPFEDRLIRSLDAEQLRRSMRLVLSPLEWRVASLYLEGYGPVEISSLLRTSFKSVDNALWRVKTKLRNLDSKHISKAVQDSKTSQGAVKREKRKKIEGNPS